MKPFAILLFAVALADLAAGFSGRPKGPVRCGVAWVIGVGGGAALAWSLGFGVEAVRFVGILLAIHLPLWFWVRSADRISPVRGAIGFWGLLLLLVALIGTGSRWPVTDGGALGRSLRDIPLQGFDGPHSRVVLCFSLVLFLIATANGVVRLVLAMSGASAYQERRLRGGRMIGPLERLLIFGFVVVGQITAAVLVVTAKTLLRFPEVSRESRAGRSREIHLLNEYLVIGSLTSWGLAFLAGALLRASTVG